jgi:hypothetical protein
MRRLLAGGDGRFTRASRSWGARVTDDSPPADELREAAAHGVRWSSITRPAIEVIQLVSTIILALLIVPAEFGRYAVALIAQEVAVAGGLVAALVQRKTISLDCRGAGSSGLVAGFR